MIEQVEPAVKIKNLSVTLGRQVRALKNIDLDLAEGKIIGFIGPSGAGKTTLIKSIVGRLATLEDSVEIFGLPAGAPALRKTVTYMTQGLSVYADLTARENLHYFARMAGQSKKEAAQTTKELLAMMDLSNRADTITGVLSGGQKQRVSLAAALIGSPKLMVLDEPTVGLDPSLRNDLWQLFKDLAAKGATIIISSHSMDEAGRCDDLVLIRDGRVITHSTPEELLRNTDTKSVEQAFLKLAGNAK